MPELRRSLVAQLEDYNVRIETLGRDAVMFRDVPTNCASFSKPATNLLVKRPRRGMPFVICVDHDLDYTGDDPSLAHAFTRAPSSNGWRVLLGGHAWPREIEPAVEQGLALVGFPGDGSALAVEQDRAKREDGLLARLGADLAEAEAEAGPEPTVGREDAVEDALCCLMAGHEPVFALLAGPSGVGKSNLLRALAAGLAACPAACRLVRIEGERLMSGSLFAADRETSLERILDEAAGEPDGVLAFEHAEQLVCEVPRGGLLLAGALDAGVRAVGTVLSEYAPLFSAPPLARRVRLLDLPEPSARAAREMVAAHCERIGSAQGVEIPEPLVGTCVKAAGSLPGCFPAKAIALLAAAAARAALAGSGAVTPDDVYSALSRIQSTAAPG